MSFSAVESDQKKNQLYKVIRYAYSPIFLQDLFELVAWSPKAKGPAEKNRGGAQ